MRRAGWTGLLAAAIPAAVIVVFFLYPVGAVLARGLSIEGLTEVAGDARLRGVVRFTFWQAVVSTLLTLAVALPGAWVLGRYRFRGRDALWAGVTVPFVLPTVVVAAAFAALLGSRGPLGFLGIRAGVMPVLVAHVFFNYAVVARTVGAALAAGDRRVEEAAATLGASRLQVMTRVSLPLAAPAIGAAAAVVFLFTFTSFGVVLVLGGPRLATIDVEIWRQTAFFLDLRVASGLAVVQLAAVAAALLAYGRAQRSIPPVAVRSPREPRRVRTAGERALVAANVAVMALLLGGPMAVLAHRSVDTGTGIGLAYYRALGSSRRGSSLFVPPVDAIRNSVLVALAATAIAVVLGGIVAAMVVYRRGVASRGLAVATTLPIGTSAVTIGLGFLIALDAPPIDFRGARWLIPVAHALVATPFVVRIVTPALQAIDPRLRDAAAALGASPLRSRLAVDLPLVSRPLLVAAGFAFAVSIGEFGATVFLARPDFPTMPVAIFRFLGQPGPRNAGQAMAMSTVLMVVTAAAVVAIERVRGPSSGTI